MAHGLHQYDALPEGRWFRLLLIHPGHFNDPLNCDLVSIALDDAPEYKALSYVWGDPGKVEAITCSGYQREITVSLFEGLQRLRGTDKVEMAWADAICINQSDNKEKSFQVNQMGDIYDKAAEVVVWLGRDDDDVAEIAFGGLLQVNKAIREKKDTAWSSVSSEVLEITTGPVPWRSHGPSMVHRITLEQIVKPSVSNAIKELYQLAWFTRVWILQEVGLATVATAFWGSSKIDFGEIGEFIYHAMLHKNLTTVLPRDVQDIISGSPYYALYNVWFTYNKKNSWVSRSPVLSPQVRWLIENTTVDMLLVLEASRRLNATNPLDHVFAFLGHPKALQPGTKKTLIEANYSTTLEALHSSLASKLAEKSLNFLVQVQNQTADIDPSNIHPSWIPQWNINKPEAPVAFWEAWDASLHVSRPLTASTVANVFGNTLKATALLFDKVEAHTQTMKKTRLEDPINGCVDSIIECWDLAAQCQHAYGNHCLIAFAATLECYYKTKETTESEPRKAANSLMRYFGIKKPGFLESRLGKPVLGYSMGTRSEMEDYGKIFKDYGTNRRFFTSAQGYFGLGPSCMEQGDVCAVLFGADVPFILRRTATEGNFRLVGQAYIYGAMYGEIVKDWEAGGVGYEKKDVCLV